MRVFHVLKEKVNLKELWNRVRSLEPNKKVKIVVIFLAVMVGLTIISRVTYQMILPKVVMGQADSGTIRHTIHTQAEVKSLSESPVFTTEGLLVDKVVVSTGQAVRKGDVLYTIEKHTLDQMIAEEQGEVNAVSKQIQQLKAESDGTSVSAEVYSLQQESWKKEQLLQEHKKIKRAGYGICAPRDGVVTAIETKAGQKTQGTADVMLADSGKNLTAVVTLSSDEESSYVSKDTVASVSSSDGKSADNLSIASIDTREADGTVLVNIPLPQNEFLLGQLLSVELNSSSQKYDCCIPRSALNMEGSSYFVFAVTAEETILGREYTAKKMEVNVLDKNRESVAVEGISSGQMIIIQSDKILSDGNKVRKMR